MKNTITKFVCDNCRKEISVSVDSTKSPPGWLELVSFEMTGILHRNEMESKIVVKNKDFCSKNCLMDLINREIGIGPEMQEVVDRLERYPQRPRYMEDLPEPPKYKDNIPPPYPEFNKNKESLIYSNPESFKYTPTEFDPPIPPEKVKKKSRLWF